MRIVFAGGGTGGHLYPALALARYLKSHSAGFECLFLGSSGGLEVELVPRAGFELEVIPGSGFRRLGLSGRARAILGLLRGFTRALAVLQRWRPDVVVATGGYASLAGGLAAACLRKPLVVQEQNSIPGFSNRVLGRFAEQIHTAFPGTERFFGVRADVRLTGNPLREDLLSGRELLEDLPAGSPVVLVVGGSRGARSINTAVAEAIPLLRSALHPYWVWQTGGLDHPRLASDWSDAADVRLQAYLEDIGAAYRSATLLVCRAGAMTISEITALGKPAILVPFPGAVDDHQTANARLLVEAGAAVLVPDRELDGQRLAQEIDALLSHPGRLEEMAANLQRLARPQATAQLAEAVQELIRIGSGGVAYVRAG